MHTVNISLPKTMYDDAKKLMKQKGYSSLSELVRDSLRRNLYPHLTVNGFTEEFEEEVLRAAAEPDVADVWETPEDIKRFFEKFRADRADRQKKKSNGKN